MTRIVCVMTAIASALAMPILALAQVGDQPSTSKAPPAPLGQASTAEQRARVATRMVRIIPTQPIGFADREAIFSPVEASEIDQLRSDLISLSEILAGLSPDLASQMAVGNFDEDHIQAITDEQMTVMYNIVPDPTGFHIAVASLREANRQATARQAAAAEARKMMARGKTDGQTEQDAARPEGITPLLDVDGLSEPITDPVFYTGGCPGSYYNAEAIYAFHVIRNTLAIAVVIAKSVLDAATVTIFGTGSNVPFVVVWTALRVAQNANDFGLDLVEFCDGSVRDAYNDKTYDNLIAIHKNLNEHDTIEKAFLKEFRELYIRKEIEKNLLLTADLRISLFQLPEPPMMTPHEGVGINKVKDIVLDTIQRNQLAGMPIGNAQTLYNDGVTLLGQNRYKDAYARFRSAYQAAVNQTVR